MTRENLLKYLEDAKNVIVQLPEDYDIIDVDIYEPSGHPITWYRQPVAVHVHGAYDDLPTEAKEWGETLVEAPGDYYSTRYFDAGNVRVFTLGFSEEKEDDEDDG